MPKTQTLVSDVIASDQSECSAEMSDEEEEEEDQLQLDDDSSDSYELEDDELDDDNAIPRESPEPASPTPRNSGPSRRESMNLKDYVPEILEDETDEQWNLWEKILQQLKAMFPNADDDFDNLSWNDECAQIIVDLVERGPSSDYLMYQWIKGLRQAGLRELQDICVAIEAFEEKAKSKRQTEKTKLCLKKWGKNLIQRLDGFFHDDECFVEDMRDKCLLLKTTVKERFLPMLNGRRSSIENLRNVLVQGEWNFSRHHGRKDRGYYVAEYGLYCQNHGIPNELEP